MSRVVSWRSRERDSHTARVQKVAMRPFASPIRKPMLFQIRNKLSNLPRHIKLASKKQLQSNAKLPKFIAAIPVLARQRTRSERWPYTISSLVIRASSFPPFVSSVVLLVVPYSCPFVVKRNQLDAELRKLDKELWGKEK